MKKKLKKFLSIFSKKKNPEEIKNILLLTKTRGDIEIPLDEANIIFVSTKSIENVFLMGLKSLTNYKLKIGDGVLLTNQSNPLENGVYEVNQGYWKRITLPENKYNVIIVTKGLFMDTKYLIYGNEHFIDNINSLVIKTSIDNKINDIMNLNIINIIDLRNNNDAVNICERKI